jgi:hypothetical protein
MHDYDEDNDGRYPDENSVQVRYPRSKQEEQGDREQWPWLPGTIVEQRGPDEWYVCIEVRELAVLRDGRRAPRRPPSRNSSVMNPPSLTFRSRSRAITRRRTVVLPLPGNPVSKIRGYAAVRVSRRLDTTPALAAS